MYEKGEGVPQNLIKAYVWCSLASANGNGLAKKSLAILRSKMTPQQIGQAENETSKLQERINSSKK
jgi:TPR repeat protein